MTYESRITKKVVAMQGKAIYDESATVIEIDDEAAGEFIVLRQDDGKIKIDGDEWPAIRAAIDELVADLRDEDGKKQAQTKSVAEMFRNCMSDELFLGCSAI
jgi:hypothetical protein